MAKTRGRLAEYRTSLQRNEPRRMTRSMTRKSLGVSDSGNSGNGTPKSRKRLNEDEKTLGTFDKLLDSPHRRKVQSKTYQNKRRKPNEPKEENTMGNIDLSRGSYKEKIISWLNDKRNDFNKFSQFQENQFGNNEENTQDLDMPSVSQAGPKRPKRPLPSINANKLLNQRARSFEIKDVPPKTNFKRYSSNCETTKNKNVVDNVDNGNALDENIILQMKNLEDEFLEDIDNEFPINNNNNNNKSASPVDSSGWDRMKNVKKDIKKPKKEPRKLNVTVSQRKSSRLCNKNQSKCATEEKSDKFVNEQANCVTVDVDVDDVFSQKEEHLEKNFDSTCIELNQIVDLEKFENFAANTEISPVKITTSFIKTTSEKEKEKEDIGRLCDYSDLKEKQKREVKEDLRTVDNLVNEIDILLENFKNCFQLNEQIENDDDEFESLVGRTNIEQYFNKLNPKLIKLKYFTKKLLKRGPGWMEYLIRQSMIMDGNTQTESNMQEVEIQTDGSYTRCATSQTYPTNIENVKTNTKAKVFHNVELQTDDHLMINEPVKTDCAIIQTDDIATNNIYTQTPKISVAEESVQTSNNKGCDKQVQARFYQEKLNMNDIGIQTNNYCDKNIQVITCNNCGNQLNLFDDNKGVQAGSPNIGNNMDVVQIDLNIDNKSGNENGEKNIVEIVEIEQAKLSENGNNGEQESKDIGNLGGDTLDFLDFDTQAIEEYFSGNPSSNLIISMNMSKQQPTNQAPLPKESENKKRPLTDCQENEDTKRPCNKFLPQDLSVNFESQAFEENLPKATDTGMSGAAKDLIEACDAILDALNDSPQFTDSLDVLLEKEENILISDNESELNQVQLSGIRPFTQDDLSPLPEQELIENKYNPHSESLFAPTVEQVRCNDNLATEQNANITRKEKSKVIVLQNVIIPAPQQFFMEEDDDDDIIQCTPQENQEDDDWKNEPNGLDITLPPPSDFQDYDNEDDITLIEEQPSPMPVVEKYNRPTSTQLSGATQRSQSETLGFSPINLSRQSKLTVPVKKSVLEIPKKSKFSPLTIITAKPSSGLPLTPKKTVQTTLLDFTNQIIEKEIEVMREFLEYKSSKPIITFSRLKKDEQQAVLTLSSKNMVQYSSIFSDKITHLIMSVDENNCIQQHTMKYVSAVAKGLWVVSPKWAQTCLEEKRLVPEEAYEVLDINGADGPKRSRLAKGDTPKLLSGWKIYSAGPFLFSTKQEVENLLLICGAKIAHSLDDLLDREGCICVILVETGASQFTGTQYDEWFKEYKTVIVDVEWLSRTIGQFKVANLRMYSLCLSDESVHELLGYPPELLAIDQSYFTLSSKDNTII